MSLSQEEIARFHSDGLVGPFSAFEPALGPPLLTRVTDEILTHKCEVYAHTSGDFNHKVSVTRDRHLDSPLMYRIASLPAIVSRVVSLLGPDVLLWRSDIFQQRPTDATTYPHQDVDLSGTRVIPSLEAGEGSPHLGYVPRHGGDLALPLCVSAYIAFTDMRPETGALWVVPGTHKQVIAEVPGDGFAGRPFVLERNFEPSDGIAVDLRPGQFILFHNLLVHGSLPTATTRLAWTTRYVTPDTRVHPRGTVNPQGQNLQRYGALLVAGRDRPRTNVLRAPPLTGAGSLVEETGVAP